MACFSSSMLMAQTKSRFRFHICNNINVENNNHVNYPMVSMPMSNPVVNQQDDEKNGYTYTPPLVMALKTAVEKDTVSFHIPGHNKGKAAPSSLTDLIGHIPFVYDNPFVLPDSVILDAEKQAAMVFGASHTWFLTGGTTSGVQAAIMATCSPGDALILPRNSHMSAISGMILSGALPKYIVPQYDLDWDIANPVTLSQVKEAINDLHSQRQKIGAVFITSQTYYGVCVTNLKGISELCHSQGILLIVDEAHGAHFGFHPELPISALDQGADVVVQSTHKVLSSLTQSSMLHMTSHSNLVDKERINKCLQMLQSTSPSHLLQASLDATSAQLCSNPQQIFNKAIRLAFEAKTIIRQIPGLSLLDYTANYSHTKVNIDPLRVVVGFQRLGVSGSEANKFLYENHGVISEVVGTCSITFIFTTGIQEQDVERLLLGLRHLGLLYTMNVSDQKTSNVENKRQFMQPCDDFEIKISPRDAFFARKTKVEVEKSVGRISGELIICPFPPGIPIIFPGEMITTRMINYVKELIKEGRATCGASDPLLASILVCDI